MSAKGTISEEEKLERQNLEYLYQLEKEQRKRNVKLKARFGKPPSASLASINQEYVRWRIREEIDPRSVNLSLLAEPSSPKSNKP